MDIIIYKVLNLVVVDKHLQISALLVSVEQMTILNVPNRINYKFW